MKKLLVLVLIFMGGYWAYKASEQHTKRCLFVRNGQCFQCHQQETVPVAYKENCTLCPNRTAVYIQEGLMPAWQCAVKEKVAETAQVERSKAICPFNAPLKDWLGNCFSCEAENPVRVGGKKSKEVCDKKRYHLPDGVAEKSLKCPPIEQITDPEICWQCGGSLNQKGCAPKGKNRFCETNEMCQANEWCYPFKMPTKNKKGVCVRQTEEDWIFTQTDGYDLASVTEFCSRQGMRLPILEEIEQAKQKLLAQAPKTDVWIFFNPNGVVWLKSLEDEFIFTREGESEKLGGHHFYGLCHKN